MIPEGRTSLMHRYLDPSSSLGEILFGLIMTLTFTLGAGIIIEDEGVEGVRQLLIAVIGCNIAWGIIDGAMYLVDQLFDRGRVRRAIHAVRTAPDERTALTLVAARLDEYLEKVTSAEEREALYARIASKLRTSVEPASSIGKADLLGALTSCVLVAATSAPAAIPFLLFDNMHFALRVSNAILLGLLFITGFLWSRHTLGNPWLVGLAFLFSGVVLVVAAIALGG